MDCQTGMDSTSGRMVVTIKETLSKVSGMGSESGRNPISITANHTEGTIYLIKSQDTACMCGMKEITIRAISMKISSTEWGNFIVTDNQFTMECGRMAVKHHI
jgi:hypothetical protein